MYEVKTKRNNNNVVDFIMSQENNRRKQDSFTLLDLFKQVTNELPIMWGDSIIGFGAYHYTNKSGYSGDWMAVGFSPRKTNMTLYLSYDFTENKKELLEKLGKHRTGKTCLYINKLADVDMKILRQLVKESYEEMKLK